MQVSGPKNLRRAPHYANPALVIAHPGHELKVFGWMAEAAPRVYILTDGSGGAASRLASTEKVLQVGGATPAGLFGEFPDTEIYAAVLEQRTALFLGILDRLTDGLLQHRIDFVAGDAIEGFNPTHDICRVLLNAAVAAAERASSGTIANYEFCLTEWEQHCHEVHDHRCMHLRLDDSLLAKKLEVAANYKELKGEIRPAIALKGEEYFRTECLRKVTEPFPSLEAATKPYYETFGEERVAQGKYSSVIRYQQHMLPIFAALREHAFNQSRRPGRFPLATAAASNY